MLIHSIKLVVRTSLKQQHDNPSKRIPLQLSTHSLKYFSCFAPKPHCGYTNSPKRYKLKPYAAISKILHLLYLFWSISPCRFYFAYFVTSTPSTENNNALTRTLSTKRPPPDKNPQHISQHIKDLSSLKISAF